MGIVKMSYLRNFVKAFEKKPMFWKIIFFLAAIKVNVSISLYQVLWLDFFSGRGRKSGCNKRESYSSIEIYPICSRRA